MVSTTSAVPSNFSLTVLTTLSPDQNANTTLFPSNNGPVVGSSHKVTGSDGLSHSEEAAVAGCQPGDFFNFLGLLLQAILAGLAFSLLMIKRIREPIDVRRGWRIWFYDTSKQAAGAGLIHFINIFTSGFYSGDPCTWYIISFLLDSTLGLLIIYVGLFISQVIARKRRLQHLMLGEYGSTSPEQVKAWLSQFGVYLLVLCVEKLTVGLLMIPKFWHRVRDLILLPFTGSSDIELIVTMLIIPFSVNALMFWLVDNFLMHRGQQERYTKIMTTLHNSRIVYGPNSDQYGDAQILIFNSVEEQRLETDINPFLADAQMKFT